MVVNGVGGVLKKLVGHMEFVFGNSLVGVKRNF
jgi:hypothetical protein